MMLLGLCTGLLNSRRAHLETCSVTNASSEYWQFILDYAVLAGLGGDFLNVAAYACAGQFPVQDVALRQV